MIVFLSLIYFGLFFLLSKIKLVPWNRKTQGVAIGIYVAALVLLVVGMNLCQPYSPASVVSVRTAPIVARVAGPVIEVPVQPNVPVKKGDVLLKIDPEPYEVEVDRQEWLPPRNRRDRHRA